MENPTNPFLNWPYYHQDKLIAVVSMEDLRQTLLYTTLELESTRIAARDEIAKREEKLTHVKDLLSRVAKERDDAEEKFRKFRLDKLLMQHKSPSLGVNSRVTGVIEDEYKVKKDGVSLSDCEESIISSAAPRPPRYLPDAAIEVMLTGKALPEMGEFLQAVVKAGPLLQTLLLTGPLPHWKNPPPPLETFEIPPVQIPTFSGAEEFLTNESNCESVVNSRKRSYFGGVCDGSSPETNKCQRVLLH